MREITLLLLLLGVLQAHAGEKKKLNLTPPGQTAVTSEDPGSATHLLYEDPRNANSITAGSEKKLPVQINSTCTDNMGMIYKQGDIGYEGCVRSFGKGTAPSARGDDKRPNSVGITIGR